MSGVFTNCYATKWRLRHGSNRNDGDGQKSRPSQPSCRANVKVCDRVFGLWFVFARGSYARPPVSGALPLKASFIPSSPQRELRDLTRYRVRLTEEKAREVNRVQKTLEDTNLKLGDVVSDIMGKASRLILQAIADGETDPGRLAALAVGRVRATQEQLEAALRGTVTDHHRFLLSEHLTQIHHLEQAIERVSAEIVRR